MRARAGQSGGGDSGMQGLININGELCSPEAATIPVLDHGFLYGDSV